MGTRPNEWDVSVSLGLCSELRSGFGRPDPADYLDGFASSAYPTRLEAAQRLRGSARIRALAALDLALMRNVAPAVVTSRLDAQFFFSDRVDLSSLAYEPAVGNWSIASLALK